MFSEAAIKKRGRKGPVLFIGAPGEIRTPDRPVRSRVLYPAELRAHCSVFQNTVAEREGLIRSFHSLTLRAHFVRPNRLRRFVEPYCLFRGFEFYLSTLILGPSIRAQESMWRRERDSNPRRGISPYSLSRGALSAAQPSLHMFNSCSIPFTERGMDSSLRSSPP